MFVDVSALVAHNPPGLHYGVAVADLNADGRFEFAVAGFDDVPLARYLALTTVSVRIAEIGERAVARLIGLLDGEADEAGCELHAPELIVRATTGPGASGAASRPRAGGI